MNKQQKCSLFTIPNAFSLLRIFLTPLFLYLSFSKKEYLALGVFCTAAWTDWADGYFARRLQQESLFGELIDPIADKILLVASYIGFYLLGYVPFWLMLIVVGRDVLLLCAGLVILSLGKNFKMKAIMISKINTCFQISHIVLALFHLPDLILSISSFFVATTTLLSGFSYMYMLKSWYYEEKKV